MPSYLTDEDLAAYMQQFEDIVAASYYDMHRKLRFDIMFHSETFNSIPNWLSLEGCWKEASLLALWGDWSSHCNLPGEEIPIENAHITEPQLTYATTSTK